MANDLIAPKNVSLEDSLTELDVIAAELSGSVYGSRLKKATKAVRKRFRDYLAPRASERDELYAIALDEMGRCPPDSLERAVAAAVAKFLGDRDCLLPGERNALGISSEDAARHARRINPGG